MEEGFTFCRKRTLISMKPVQPPCKIHELSSLDIIMKNQHLKIIYYFKTPVGWPIGKLTSNIRESLSETLSYYPVFIGRLLVNNDDGKWTIKCNDAGMILIEARVKGSVQNWLENVDNEKENKLVYWDDMFEISDLWPMFYLKVTEFEEGGFAVGVSCARMIADPVCVTLFMKAVSEITLGRKISIPPFFHPLLPKHRLNFDKSRNETVVNSYINDYKSLLQRSPNSNMIKKYKTIAFEFKDEMIQSCIKSAQLNESMDSNDTCSLGFIALVGLFWNCISRIKGLKYGLIEMSICLDMRKTLGLDQGFLGNCMIRNEVHGVDMKVDNDLVLSTNAIKKVISNVNKEDMFDLITWLGDFENDNLSSDDNLTFVNLENVDPYSTMFIEDYEPIRVSYYSESIVEKDKVFILPSRHHKGRLSRVVMVTLPAEQVTRLREDAYLNRYCPTVIMGPKCN